MLYKPGKSKAAGNGGQPGKADSSPQPATAAKQQQQQQHQKPWHWLGNLLSHFSWFGSHQSLGAAEGSGNQTKQQTAEDQQPQAENPKDLKQRRQLKQHLKRRKSLRRLQHSRPASAVSCHDLTQDPAALNTDGTAGLTSSDEEDVGGKPGANRVAKWATGLGNLLADPDGIRVFAGFLRSEFSEENINFWLAVEEFKRLDEPDKLLAAARKIARNHIGSDAPASVNLDCATVRELQSRLRCGQHDCLLFKEAQDHIFNLMRLDSYARFLKSSIYKDCLLCELESRPLPAPAGKSTSLHSSADSLLSAPRWQQKHQAGGNSRRVSRDFILEAECDPDTVGQLSGRCWPQEQQQLGGTFLPNRRPSLIVAALDLDCGFSVC